MILFSGGLCMCTGTFPSTSNPAPCNLIHLHAAWPACEQESNMETTGAVFQLLPSLP